MTDKLDSLSYSLGERPIVVGRVPILSLETAAELYSADDPITKIRELLTAHPHLLTAIWLASPSLYDAAAAWIYDGRPFKNQRAAIKILMYLLRMAARPTPYGIFAAIGRVAVGCATNLRITDFRTASRIDMGWLYESIENLTGDAKQRQALDIYLNDALIERGDRLFVFNPRKVDAYGPSGPDYARISLVKTPGVALVCEIAAGGIQLSELIRRVEEQFECDTERATSFIDKLCDAGLLLFAAYPSPSGDPVGRVLHNFRGISTAAQAIEATTHELHRLDGLPIGERRITDYQKLTETLNSVNRYSQAPIQVDTAVRFNGTVSNSVLERVCRLADYSMRWSTSRNTLAKFRDRFIKRYEGVDTIVPLLELVDPDFGLGRPEPATDAPAIAESKSQLLFRIAERALLDGNLDIELDSSELSQLIPSVSEGDVLPETIELGFFIDAQTPDSIDNEKYLVGQSVLAGTSGAGRTLGRFAHLFDEDLLHDVKDLLKTHSTHGSTLCELVYSPVHGRAVNVSIRPRVCDAELQIGLLDKSVERLAPSDILVGLRRNRFYLWSKTLQREIKIRESHVLSGYMPGAIAFLSMLASQDMIVPTSFDWGAANRLTFLPRLQHDGIVISPARWKVDLEEIRKADDVTGSFRAFCTRYKVPQFVLMGDSDNRLLLKTDHPLAVDLMLNATKPKALSPVLLTECLPSLDSRWLMSEQGPHASEFVASLVRHRAAEVVPLPKTELITPEVRIRTPESEWTYVQAFLGPTFQDGAITECHDLATELRTAGICTGWFFIRYSDPHEHLRFRFLAAPSQRENLNHQVGGFMERLMRSGYLVDYSYHTYHREVERYGGPQAIDMIEQLFEASSDIVAETLKAGEVEALDLRVLAAAKTVDVLFRPLIEDIGIARWLDLTRPHKRKLTQDAWRLIRQLKLAVMSSKASVSDSVNNAHKQLVHCAQHALLCRPLEEILSSLIHLHCNRFGLTVAETDVRIALWHAYYAVEQMATRMNEPKVLESVG